MKLSAGILAALATTGDAAVSCDSGDPLFEVTCDVSSGFQVVVNEACRASFFTMVDFANSFVWKDSTVTAMASPLDADAYADAVVSGQFCTDSSSNDVSMKPASTGITDDASSPAFGWTVPLSCATMTQVSDGTNNEYVKYELYWNSQFNDATQNMYQLGQVMFTCRIDPYQEDATGTVTVSEDTAVDDATEKYVDIAAALELNIYKATFDGGSIDESTLTTVAVDSDAGTYGQTSLTYTLATTADLGDYMQLKLENASGQTALTDFAVSLTKCWASTAELAATDGGTAYYTDTSTAGGAAGEFLFWDEFCPKYPSWVGPNPSSVTDGYLMETWEGASSLHAVHFRQFGFNTEQTNYVGSGSDIYYHCFVKVCDSADKATCSTETLTGTARACTETAYTSPSARRRRQAEEAEAEAGATEIDAPVIEVPTAECGAEATVCDVTNAAADAAETAADALVDAVEAAVDAAVDAMNSEVADVAEYESAAAQATLGLAALTLAMLN